NITVFVIKFKNLKISPPTTTIKLIDSGYDFNVRVLAKSDLASAQALRNEMIDLLSASGRTVINHVA
ncbi:MAG: hypothetical protein VYA01_03975, partial [Bacteroidota bacterium]|nr:hypothetical protein [Bacteroidota bacterium]